MNAIFFLAVMLALTSLNTESSFAGNTIQSLGMPTMALPSSGSTATIQSLPAQPDQQAQSKNKKKTMQPATNGQIMGNQSPRMTTTATPEIKPHTAVIGTGMGNKSPAPVHQPGNISRPAAPRLQTPTKAVTIGGGHQQRKAPASHGLVHSSPAYNRAPKAVGIPAAPHFPSATTLSKPPAPRFHAPDRHVTVGSGQRGSKLPAAPSFGQPSPVIKKAFQDPGTMTVNRRTVVHLTASPNMITKRTLVHVHVSGRYADTVEITRSRNLQLGMRSRVVKTLSHLKGKPFNTNLNLWVDPKKERVDSRGMITIISADAKNKDFVGRALEKIIFAQGAASSRLNSINLKTGAHPKKQTVTLPERSQPSRGGFAGKQLPTRGGFAPQDTTVLPGSVKGTTQTIGEIGGKNAKPFIGEFRIYPGGKDSGISSRYYIAPKLDYKIRFEVAGADKVILSRDSAIIKTFDKLDPGHSKSFMVPRKNEFVGAGISEKYKLKALHHVGYLKWETSKEITVMSRQNVPKIYDFSITHVRNTGGHRTGEISIKFSQAESVMLDYLSHDSAVAREWRRIPLKHGKLTRSKTYTFVKQVSLDKWEDHFRITLQSRGGVPLIRTLRFNIHDGDHPQLIDRSMLLMGTVGTKYQLGGRLITEIEYQNISKLQVGLNLSGACTASYPLGPPPSPKPIWGEMKINQMVNYSCKGGSKGKKLYGRLSAQYEVKDTNGKAAKKIKYSNRFQITSDQHLKVKRLYLEGGNAIPKGNSAKLRAVVLNPGNADIKVYKWDGVMGYQLYKDERITTNPDDYLEKHPVSTYKLDIPIGIYFLNRIKVVIIDSGKKIEQKIFDLRPYQKISYHVRVDISTDVLADAVPVTVDLECGDHSSHEVVGSGFQRGENTMTKSIHIPFAKGAMHHDYTFNVTLFRKYKMSGGIYDPLGNFGCYIASVIASGRSPLIYPFMNWQERRGPFDRYHIVINPVTTKYSGDGLSLQDIDNSKSGDQVLKVNQRVKVDIQGKDWKKR